MKSITSGILPFLVAHTCLVTLIFVITVSRAFAQQTAEPDREIQIEEFAKFPGGAEKFYEYINDNLRYPASAQRDSLGGVVYIEFMIGKDGAIDRGSLKVVQSLSPDCDDEAMRLIKAAPAWLPARANEEQVGQSIRFPVSFEWEKE